MTALGNVLQGSQAKLAHEMLALTTAGLARLSQVVATQPLQQVVAAPVTYMRVYSFMSTVLPYAINAKTAIPFATVLYVISPDKVKDLVANVLNMPIRVLNQLHGPDSVDKHIENLQALQAENTSTAPMVVELSQLVDSLTDPNKVHRLRQIVGDLQTAESELAATEESFQQSKQELEETMNELLTLQTELTTARAARDQALTECAVPLQKPAGIISSNNPPLNLPTNL